MTTADEAVAAGAWERFADTPSLDAHPSRVAELFGGALGADQAGRLARRPRFAERLSGLLARRHGFGAAQRPADIRDLAIALSSGDEIAALARRAGAVCWADPIAREVRAAEVAALKEAIGDDAYAAALAHRDEALPAVALGIDGAPDRATILTGVAGSARQCLGGWLASQSAEIAQRVRLRLPVEAVADAPQDIYLEAGPRIFRRLAR